MDSWPKSSAVSLELRTRYFTLCKAQEIKRNLKALEPQIKKPVNFYAQIEKAAKQMIFNNCIWLIVHKLPTLYRRQSLLTSVVSNIKLWLFGSTITSSDKYEKLINKWKYLDINHIP